MFFKIGQHSYEDDIGFLVERFDFTAESGTCAAFGIRKTYVVISYEDALGSRNVSYPIALVKAVRQGFAYSGGVVGQIPDNVACDHVEQLAA